MMLQCRHAQEFSFGPRALKDALISTDPVLQELYLQTFSSSERLFLSEAYNPRRTLFCTLLIRTASDWVISHPDAPEDFETFYRSLPMKKQKRYRKNIYLQPIDLSEEPAVISLLDCLRSWLESFFLGLQVNCLPSIPISSINCSFRQNQQSNRMQLHTDGILNFLKRNKPLDAVCVLGLTLIDIYPCESWRYTFSKSLPGEEVGVCSFARFTKDFPQSVSATLKRAGESEGIREFSMVEIILCCKVIGHEIGHLLGLGRCRWLHCIMQGTRSLNEVHVQPLELCPVCLRKLQYLLGFKLRERYQKLHVWTQTVLATGAGERSADHSVSEDILPFSEDSGMGFENEPEHQMSLSESLSLDTYSQAFTIDREPEDDGTSCTLGDTSSQQEPDEASPSLDMLHKYEGWLESCMAVLDRVAPIEELSKVDKEVDGLTTWEMFTGQLPSVKKDLTLRTDKRGLKRVLGAKFSSFRRKLSSRKLARSECSPHRWRCEEG
ncbi:archaemetzincin-1 isoform X2 [Rhinatrema bivittatum]|uniref:archaemetzincin-1 isoform X2 n=1 Tax=Rhinatrema bivittatum TaxID=194408 RepID=UPI0011263DE9|nr:archaemetzincin-1 isoform X2 [Rhinatrema bivittatum]XP_029433413.1 archaemetzincin-1 isoform X2 [Rhinatrema bivittatum]XP_029433414.1 archaemetzincin-1 isoform X2 [Rhinatrema bivittatum]